MQIRKLDRNTYDVFGGIGFDSWTRLRRFHWGFKQIGGVFLPRPTLHIVIEGIQNNPEGSIDNIDVSQQEELDVATQ